MVAVATASAPLFKWNRTKMLLISTSIAIVVFIPSCAAIKSMVDARRFGVFDIPEFNKVDDARVERYLPPAARGITIDKTAMGYRARFTITQTELDAWLDGVRTQCSEDSTNHGSEKHLEQQVRRESFEADFEGLGWQIPVELTEYDGPVASNGAGFTIWYDAQTQTAFQRAGYW